MPHRIHDEDAVRHLKLMGDLGMINAIPFHARDRASIAEAVEKSDVVINLLGTSSSSCLCNSSSSCLCNLYFFIVNVCSDDRDSTGSDREVCL